MLTDSCYYAFNDQTFLGGGKSHKHSNIFTLTKPFRGCDCDTAANKIILLNIKNKQVSGGSSELTSNTARRGIYEWNRTRARAHADANETRFDRQPKIETTACADWLWNGSLSPTLQLFHFFPLSLYHAHIHTHTHSRTHAHTLPPTAVCHPARLWRRPYVSHRWTLTVSGPPVPQRRHNSSQWQRWRHGGTVPNTLSAGEETCCRGRNHVLGVN